MRRQHAWQRACAGSSGSHVLGPEFPVIMQVQKWYIKTIMIKIDSSLSPSKVKGGGTQGHGARAEDDKERDLAHPCRCRPAVTTVAHWY
ncbi:MAG: hypothetical protein MZV63_52910 [Marinilabiliales bacterium]|nr:hypothetical protein [Marinilabiliales bacterium]